MLICIHVVTTVAKTCIVEWSKEESISWILSPDAALLNESCTSTFFYDMLPILRLKKDSRPTQAYTLSPTGWNFCKYIYVIRKDVRPKLLSNTPVCTVNPV